MILGTEESTKNEIAAGRSSPPHAATYHEDTAIKHLTEDKGGIGVTDSYDIITLEEFIEKHQEIEQFEIFKIWETGIVSADDGSDIVRVSGHGRVLDSEYSYVGGRKGALEFCRICDCWEEVMDTLDDVSEFGITQSYDADGKRFMIKWIDSNLGSDEIAEYIDDSAIEVRAEIELYLDDWVQVTGGVNFPKPKAIVTMKEFIGAHPEIEKVIDIHTMGFTGMNPLTCYGCSHNYLVDMEGTFIERCIVTGREEASERLNGIADSVEPCHYYVGTGQDMVPVTQRIIGDVLVRTIYHITESRVCHMPGLTLESTSFLRAGPFDDHNRATREVTF